MVSNGSLHYDHDMDGTHTSLSGCQANVRGQMHETFLAIRYEHDQLMVSVFDDFILLLLVVHSLLYPQGLHLAEKTLPLNNLPPKMAAAFLGLITNAGLMAAGMSYSYSSQKQTTSFYLYI